MGRPLYTARKSLNTEMFWSCRPNYGRVLHLRWLAVLADKWNVPKWLQRAVVQVFPADSAARRLMHVVDTMDEQSRMIYNMKKRAFEKGDAEVVKQVGEGKDILSVLSKSAVIRVRCTN